MALYTPTPSSAYFQSHWFYKPIVTNESSGNVSERWDNMILTHGDDISANTTSVKNRGHKPPLLMYVRGDSITNLTTGYFNNQVAWDGSTATFRGANADAQLTVGGTAAQDGSSYYLMNPGNAAWQSYFVSQCQQVIPTYEWDGIFLDNIRMVRPTNSSSQTITGIASNQTLYSTDAAWQSAQIAFLAALANGTTGLKKAALNSQAGVALQIWANITPLPFPAYTAGLTVWNSYLANLDGVMMEEFASGFYAGPDVWLSTSEWEGRMALVESALALNKRVLCVVQGPQTDLQRMRFGLASYMLISNGKASFRYTLDSTTYGSYYNYDWRYEDYALAQALGAPTSSRYRVGNSWRRDFTHGRVSVDPSTHIGAIILS